MNSKAKVSPIKGKTPTGAWPQNSPNTKNNQKPAKKTDRKATQSRSSKQDDPKTKSTKSKDKRDTAGNSTGKNAGSTASTSRQGNNGTKNVPQPPAEEPDEVSGKKQEHNEAVGDKSAGDGSSDRKDANENGSPPSPPGQHPSSQLEQPSEATGTIRTPEIKPTEHLINVPEASGGIDSSLQHENQQSPIQDHSTKVSPEASGAAPSPQSRTQTFRRLISYWQKMETWKKKALIIAAVIFVAILLLLVIIILSLYLTCHLPDKPAKCKTNPPGPTSTTTDIFPTTSDIEVTTELPMCEAEEEDTITFDSSDQDNPEYYGLFHSIIAHFESDEFDVLHIKVLINESLGDDIGVRASSYVGEQHVDEVPVGYQYGYRQDCVANINTRAMCLEIKYPSTAGASIDNNAELTNARIEIGLTGGDGVVTAIDSTIPNVESALGDTSFVFDTERSNYGLNFGIYRGVDPDLDTAKRNSRYACMLGTTDEWGEGDEVPTETSTDGVAVTFGQP